MRSLFANSRKLRTTSLSAFLSWVLIMGTTSADAQLCTYPNCTMLCRIHKITANVSSTIQSYMEIKPADYDAHPTKKYPLLIYLGGTGEMFQQPGGSDQDLCQVLGYSMPFRINVHQFPDSVMDPNTGKWYSYFVVMPFVTAWEQQYQVDPGAMLNYALAHYPGRIDASRIYLTAMSRGTDNIMSFVTNSVANAHRIAAIVPVANCFPPGPGTTFNTQLANLALGGVHLWGIQCAGDRVCSETYIQSFVNGLNSLNPGHAIFSYASAYCNSVDSTYHFAWNVAYSPEENRPLVSGNKNIYEWMIQFSQNVSLPVTMKDWSARLDNGKVLLQWTTSQEFNTKDFLIQRANSAGDFQTMLTVPAAIGSSTDKNYSQVDEHPNPGENLYRLVEEDMDGKQEVFPIKRVVVPGIWNENVIIPNPVNDGVASVYVRVNKAQQLTIRLIDLTGRVINQQIRQVMPGASQYTFNVSALQRGTYIIQLNGEDIKTSKKITIQ